jgi:hypothetical protein
MNVDLTPEDGYRKAYEHYTRQRYESARDICRMVLAADPAHMHAAYLLAVIEHRLGAPDAGDRWLDQALSQRPYSARLSYRPPAAPRYEETPHPALAAVLAQRLDRYVETLQAFGAWAAWLKRIPAGMTDAVTPYWDNAWIPPLDGVALYCMVARRRPRLYIEIGSGNSTKFVRRAIVDHGLDTRIVSIDPHPRAEVDRLCDEVIRSPLEAADLSVFGRLAGGDVVFVDNSHQCFMNSDVTVFFTEILPALPRGALAGIHDVFLPYDYPSAWAEKFFSEQYLLACYLLAGTGAFEVELPLNFLLRQPAAAAAVAALCEAAGGVSPTGSSFWLVKN